MIVNAIRRTRITLRPAVSFAGFLALASASARADAR